MRWPFVSRRRFERVQQDLARTARERDGAQDTLNDRQTDIGIDSIRAMLFEELLRQSRVILQHLCEGRMEPPRIDRVLTFINAALDAHGGTTERGESKYRTKSGEGSMR